MKRTRFEGAEWFKLLQKKPVFIVGQGGISSWLTLLLARVGCELYTFDKDVIDETNSAGQLFKLSDIGEYKTVALAKIVKEFTGDTVIPTADWYDKDTLTNDIVICGLDNMKARRVAFENWYAAVQPVENKGDYFFIDGRLNAELMQIFCIQGDNQEQIDAYLEHGLFDDSEVEPLECSYKQTSHCAAMIAGYMTSYLCNWAANKVNGDSIRSVPFFYELIVPLNLATINNVKEYVHSQREHEVEVRV
mgnify:CR=1 FL=1